MRGEFKIYKFFVVHAWITTLMDITYFDKHQINTDHKQEKKQKKWKKYLKEMKTKEKLYVDSMWRI